MAFYKKDLGDWTVGRPAALAPVLGAAPVAAAAWAPTAPTPLFDAYLEGVYDAAEPPHYWVDRKTGADLDYDVVKYLQELVRLAFPTGQIVVSFADVLDFARAEFAHLVGAGTISVNKAGRAVLNAQDPVSLAQGRGRQLQQAVATAVVTSRQVLPDVDLDIDPPPAPERVVSLPAPGAYVGSVVAGPMVVVDHRKGACYLCGRPSSLVTAASQTRVCGSCSQREGLDGTAAGPHGP